MKNCFDDLCLVNDLLAGKKKDFHHNIMIAFLL
jgi:hypothetical protein